MNIKQSIAAWLDKQAIPDWRQSWEKLTVKFNAALVAFGGIWLVLPDEAKAQILTAVGIPTAWVVVAIGVVGFVLRLKAQNAKAAPAEPPSKADPS